MKLKPGPLMAKAKNDAPDAGGKAPEDVAALIAERDGLRAEVERLKAELTKIGQRAAEVEAERDQALGDLDMMRGLNQKHISERDALRLQLDGLKAATPPEPERAADLPDGIAEGEVRERIRASGGALTRAQAIRAVQRQRERDALLAEPARE